MAKTCGERKSLSPEPKYLPAKSENPKWEHGCVLPSWLRLIFDQDTKKWTANTDVFLLQVMGLAGRKCGPLTVLPQSADFSYSWGPGHCDERFRSRDAVKKCSCASQSLNFPILCLTPPPSWSSTGSTVVESEKLCHLVAVWAEITELLALVLSNVKWE